MHIPDLAVAVKLKQRPEITEAYLSLVVQDIGVGPSLLVAFLAGCGNVLLTNPIWVVATRMQVQSKIVLHKTALQTQLIIASFNMSCDPSRFLTGCCLQAYEKSLEEAHLDKAPPGPLEICREIYREQGILVSAMLSNSPLFSSPSPAFVCNSECAAPST